MSPDSLAGFSRCPLCQLECGSREQLVAHVYQVMRGRGEANMPRGRDLAEIAACLEHKHISPEHLLEDGPFSPGKGRVPFLPLMGWTAPGEEALVGFPPVDPGAG